MAGRPPKPGKLKALASDTPGVTAGGRRIGVEPEPPPATGDCPKHLKGAAREKWEHLAPILLNLGLLTELDLQVLEVLCTAFADWREANKHLAEEGTIVELKSGPFVNPWKKVQREAWVMMEKAGGRLGLSPVDRVRLAVDPDARKGNKDDDEFFGPGARRPAAQRQPEANA